MKLFSSELGTNYSTYTFGYTNYCVRESSDAMNQIYTLGYLPYSGSRDTDTFYMARSARVTLPSLTLSSENRRIAKKFDGTFTKERVAYTPAMATASFVDFCHAYFADKHGASAMPRERLEHILMMGFITHLITYKAEGEVVAYVVEVGDETAGHYWFSFYDLSLAKQSLGAWLMLDCIRDAKERGLSYYYLGTVYGEKALYKTNFLPLEWWDGTGWNVDVKLLRERSRSDSSRILSLTDQWKQNLNLF